MGIDFKAWWQAKVLSEPGFEAPQGWKERARALFDAGPVEWQCFLRQYKTLYPELHDYTLNEIRRLQKERYG